MTRSRIKLLIGIFLGLFLWMNRCSFCRTYDRIDLTENYDKNEEKIKELIIYFDSIISPNTLVDIEIENSRNINMISIEQDGVYRNTWDLSINSKKADTLFMKLKWNVETVKNIRSKLDEVNCISIANGNPCAVGFQRSVMSKFSYLIFDKPLNDSTIHEYNDKCMHIFYRDNVVLRYQSGATGSFCFPKQFLNE